MTTPHAVRPKRVVYLIGAGATQAEAQYLGARPVNLLMRDSETLGEGISTLIMQRAGDSARAFVADGGLDIEKLISLLSSCGLSRMSDLADAMRRHYFEAILGRLLECRVIDRPSLAEALLQLHKHSQLQRFETLSGILSTNHDGLFQVAFQTVYKAVAIGFPFRSAAFTLANSIRIPPLLQLHGSFTWRFGTPPRVQPLVRTSRYGRDTLWIPPSILKESKSYPFNKLMAIAYDLLARQCDVLRVVGASLTQNDWNVLALIFNAQRHTESVGGTPFRIELIMSHRHGEEIAQQCSFLKNVTPVGFLTDGSFASYKDPDATSRSSEMGNTFAFWLKEKVRFHRSQGHFGTVPIGETIATVAGEAP